MRTPGSVGNEEIANEIPDEICLSGFVVGFACAAIVDQDIQPASTKQIIASNNLLSSNSPEKAHQMKNLFSPHLRAI